MYQPVMFAVSVGYIDISDNDIPISVGDIDILIDDSRKRFIEIKKKGELVRKRKENNRT